MSPLISPLGNPAATWVPPPQWTIAQFQHLCTIDMDAMAPNDVSYINEYCSSWLFDKAPNQPIRANGTTSDPQNPEIGYATFGEAKTAWRQLFPVVGVLQV